MTKKKKRIILLISIVIVLVVFFFVYSRYKQRFLNETLKEKVSTESGGLYKIEYDDIAVDEVNGELIVTNIRVTADTSRFNGNKPGADDPAAIVSFTAGRLQVSGVQTPKALLGKELKGRKLIISNAVVELFSLPVIEKKPKESDSTKISFVAQIYRDVLKDLDLVSVDTLGLDHVDFRYREYDTKKTIVSASDLSLRLYDVLIDESSKKDANRILFSKNMVVVADSIKTRDKKGNYDFIFSAVQLNSFEKDIRIKKVDIQPRKSETDFVNQFKTQKDRFNFNFHNIILNGIDLKGLAEAGLDADSLTVGQSSFKIYRDLNIPRDSVVRVGQYPHQIVMDIPFDVVIRKSFFNNAFIEYKERSDKTGKSGKVQFYKASAVIDNITNKKAALKKNNISTIDFNASFLNMTSVKVKLKLRLGDKQGRFNANGKLGPFAAEKLNELTEPMGLARIDKGNVKELVFNLDADNYTGKGSLTLLYEDLKISALKLDEDNDYKKKGIASIVANAIVKNKNPQAGKTRKATIDYKRNTNRSFFNLIWKSIFAGVKESVGMKAEEKQEAKQ